MMSPIHLLAKPKLLGLTLLIAAPSFLLSATESTPVLGLKSASDISPVSDVAVTFNDSYKAYKHAVTDNDAAAMLQYSAESYELGQQEFGDKSLDTANLALNYATALQHKDKSLDRKSKNERAEKAHQLYLIALSIYETEFGEDSLETIDPLLGAAQTSSDARKAKSQYHHAVGIAEDSERPLLLASVQMSAFNGLKNSEYYDRRVRDYALDAFEIYQEKLPQDALKRVEATYTAGMIWFAERRESKAIPLFEEVITQFSKLNYSHPYELASHARLVELYEKEGDSESSTKHCIAIGSMRPWQENQEQTPLYRINPKYPMSAASTGKEGWVQVAFTVNESGFVTDPKVVNSKGSSGFERASLKALEKWRYAPKFVDGKPVAADSLVQLDFTLDRS
ncbi:TonB family protein [Shewanella psychropiezotolerans]|uniref:Protein TonB n=1 Tax=Shewanella psychropiezotolerans TaxID=2593655 RepID=A0ABX5X466_9GAMM|nr:MULTISPECIES: TonB family protein [Shewanella]MPY21106.1 TonB family protein [Shewanella sp. YLB-07]MPY21893.1 TonB family protein [Shewanella sp. YLB-07]QDO85222.1 TonB family protein [Shewanella psychropiezotolerans]